MNGKEVRVGACLLVGDIDNMVRFYRDTLGLHTTWDGGSFAEFETANGPTTLFMYSREEFVKAIHQPYMPPRGINRDLNGQRYCLNPERPSAEALTAKYCGGNTQ